MNQVCLNGKMFPADEPVLMAGNRSFRYGDGLFETMKMAGGTLLHTSHHFERLFSGLMLTGYSIPAQFTPERLQQEIHHLCTRNECLDLARVRLSVFRGNGGLYDNDNRPHYLIEAWPLEESEKSQSEGLTIGIHPDVQKSTDRFSNLKSANFLPYRLAAEFAKTEGWNDCIVLNTNSRICDATTANVFIITGDVLKTPGLDEGCVAGIIRKIILQENYYTSGIVNGLEETALTAADLFNADEIFLTNAIHGVRSVQHFQVKTFNNSRAAQIRTRLLESSVR
jgi:branched-chain amino acid aminotransferase